MRPVARCWPLLLAPAFLCLLVQCSLFPGRSWQPYSALPEGLTGLRNVIHVTEHVLSGSQPDDDQGFDELVQLGVRTIVSVDGSYPDAERARARGIRTVHLPLRYDDVPAQHTGELVHVLEAYPRPVYVHCFHGKHRAPAAVAAALVARGEFTTAQGLQYMGHAGTSPHYAGLYAAVASVSPVSGVDLQIVRELPERATVSTLSEGMSRLARVEADLVILERASWQPVLEHPDLDIMSESRTLRALLEELEGTPFRGREERDYERRLDAAIDHARSLEKALISSDKQAASIALGRLQADCKSCHALHRDRKW